MTESKKDKLRTKYIDTEKGIDYALLIEIDEQDTLKFNPTKHARRARHVVAELPPLRHRNPDLAANVLSSIREVTRGGNNQSREDFLKDLRTFGRRINAHIGRICNDSTHLRGSTRAWHDWVPNAGEKSRQFLPYMVLHVMMKTGWDVRTATTACVFVGEAIGESLRRGIPASIYKVGVIRKRYIPKKYKFDLNGRPRRARMRAQLDWSNVFINEMAEENVYCGRYVDIRDKALKDYGRV